MQQLIRVCLAFCSVVLIAVACVGCGPQEEQPAPETPTAQPGTPPETPAGEEPEAGVTINIDELPVPETSAGSASARR